MTKTKFLIFEKVRLSGLTNMYNVDSVRLISVKYGESHLGSSLAENTHKKEMEREMDMDNWL